LIDAGLFHRFLFRIAQSKHSLDLKQRAAPTETSKGGEGSHQINSLKNEKVDR